MTVASEPAAPRKRRNPKGEARREHILEVARTIFSEGGYHSASIADIASRAEISQAGLLHHFPSKPDILLAVLNARDADAIREVSGDELDGAAYLNRYVHMLRDHAADPALVQLNAMISAEALAESHPAHDYFVTQHRVRLAEFTHSMEDAYDFGAMPEGVTAETVARWAIALAEGMRLQMLYEEKGRVDRASTLALFFETLKPYLRDPRPI